MSKLLYKMAVLVFAISLAAVVPVRAEVRDDFEAITVSVSIAGSTSFTVETHNRSDDANVDPLALNFSTAGIALPPAGSPWVLSDQYIRIVYSSNYGVWGVRVVTDNEDLEGDANDIVERIEGAPTGAGPDGIWGNADDILSFGGLVILDDEDPSHRAPWAWQVFTGTQAVVTPTTSVIGADGALADGPTVGDWNDNWAYIGDKNDSGYTGDILFDAPPPDLDVLVDDPTYPMVVVGSGGSGGTLAPHPEGASRAGDGDIVVYIATRFANTNYGGATPVPFLLPAGTYNASLYIELVHE